MGVPNPTVAFPQKYLCEYLGIRQKLAGAIQEEVFLLSREEGGYSFPWESACKKPRAGKTRNL
jgi:hypothetical protein